MHTTVLKSLTVFFASATRTWHFFKSYKFKHELDHTDLIKQFEFPRLEGNVKYLNSSYFFNQLLKCRCLACAHEGENEHNQLNEFSARQNHNRTGEICYTVVMKLAISFKRMKHSFSFFPFTE